MRELRSLHAQRRRDEESSSRAEEHERQEHRERAEAGHDSNRYPTPQTVTRWRGSDGSSSIFSRSRRMCTVTVDESPSQAKSHTLSRRSVLENVWPGCDAS